MDEVSLLVSQRVEYLQVRALSSLDSARILLHGHLQNGAAWVNEVWASERAQAVREAALRLHAWSLAMYLNAKESISQVHYEELLQRMRQIWIAEVGGPRLQWCCLGAISGCFLGLSLGISIGRRRLAIGQLRLPGMRAVICRGCQGIDGVTMAEDIPCPTISGPDQIIVQVRCASVDPADIKVCCGYGRVLRRHLGKYDPSISEFPLVLGRDGSGVVVEVGDGVRGFLPGDEVWFAIPPWVPGGGSLSQLLMLRGVKGGDEKSPTAAATGQWGAVVAHKPRGVGFEGASTVPFSACLAWEAATVGAKLGPENTKKKRVLVHGGTTGVGLLLIQLLSAWGAQVLTVVGPHGAHLARRLLPQENVLLYTEEGSAGGEGAREGGSYVSQLRWSEKFDVVFNAVGPILSEACLNSCREANPVQGIQPGIVVTAYSRPIASDTRGLLVGALCSLWTFVRSLLLSPLDLDGCSVGWVEAAVAKEALVQFGHLIESGRVIPVVGKVFPVGDAELAFQHADTTDPLGKTVIRFSKVAFCMSAAALEQRSVVLNGGTTQNLRPAARDVGTRALRKGRKPLHSAATSGEESLSGKSDC